MIYIIFFTFKPFGELKKYKNRAQDTLHPASFQNRQAYKTTLLTLLPTTTTYKPLFKE